MPSLDDLSKALEKQGFSFSRTATYYRLVPANVHQKYGKRHVHTVPVKLCRPQNPCGHFAMAPVWFARYFVNLFGDHHIFLISQDDKARVPLGLPISKTQTDILMHSEYKHKLIPFVYATCLKKDGKVSLNGPTFISIRSRKHDKNCTATHSDDFERALQPEDFQDGETTLDREVKSSKPRVFISVDGGPDEAPKNQQASACGRGNFKITTLMLSLFSPMHQVAVLTIL